MKQRNLIYLFVATTALIVATVCYLGLRSDPSEITAGSNVAMADGAAASVGASPSIVRKDDTPEKKGNTPPSFDPADYTTAPKPYTEEGKLVTVFTDRKMPDTEKVERLLAMVSELSG